MTSNLNRPLSEIMKTDVVTIEPTAVMTEVAQIFNSRQFHHLPVVSDGKPVGIISKHDYYLLLDSRTLMKMENYEGINTRWLSALMARDVMAKEPFCMQETDSLADAVDVFLTNRFHAILVCNGEQFTGIVTPYDFLLDLKQKSSIRVDLDQM